MEPIYVKSFNAHYVYVLNHIMLWDHMSQMGNC